MSVNSEARQTNQLFRLLVDSVEDYAIFLIDVDGRIASWNNGAERIKQYTAEEAIGSHIEIFYSVEDQLAMKPQNALSIAYREGRYIEEGWRVRKDGSRFWASVVITALREEGELVGYAKVTRDRTDQKIAERELLKAKDELERRVAERTSELETMHAETAKDENCYRTIVNSISALIWRWDLETNSHSCVPDWDQFTGLTSAEVAGWNWVSAIHPDERSAVDQLFRNSLLTEEHFSTEYRVRRPDGTYRHVAMRGMPLKEEDGKLIEWVGICMDITERINLAEQLRHSQKLEAVGQLAGGVAHDFNNLLTVLMGYGEILQLSELREDHRKMVNAMVDSGKRAAAVTKQLLTFSRRTLLQLRDVQLNDVVRDTEYILRRLIGQDIAVEIALDPNVRIIRADAGQISQVLINLAVNARDAMPQGGRLTVQTKNVELDDHYINTHVEVKPGRYALLMVTDTGVGMTPEVRTRIFEPFFTTKKPGQGTGLGLSVVHGIVNQLNGRIGAYSEPGIGTVIKIYFPTVSQEGVEQKTQDIFAMDATKKATVLFVDDEAGIRDVARLALDAAGYQVHIAENASLALDIARANPHEIDILITDVVMPDMSGPELANEVKLLHPKIEVLFLSGYTGDAVTRHGLLAADVNFLQKPFTPSVLLKTIAEIIAIN